MSNARPISWTNSKQGGRAIDVKPWQGHNEAMVPRRVFAAVPNKTNVYQPPHKRFTSADMDEKRAKGLCFWNDEKFIFGHKCAHRRMYSLTLEPMEIEEEEGEVRGLVNRK